MLIYFNLIREFGMQFSWLECCIWDAVVARSSRAIPTKYFIWPVWCNWLACNTVNIADGVRVSNVALLSILLDLQRKIICFFNSVSQSISLIIRSSRYSKRESLQQINTIFQFWVLKKRRLLYMICLLKGQITAYMKINYNWACV